LNKIISSKAKRSYKMPNYCNNDIAITADAETLVRLEAALDKDQLLKFAKDYGDGIGAWDATELYGTKWEPEIIGFDNDGETITITCESAWSPPLGALQMILEMPGVTYAECVYSEPGMDYCGIWRCGEDTEVTLSSLAEAVANNEPLDEIEAELAERASWLIEMINEE
jgi:hypothetical protein